MRTRLHNTPAIHLRPFRPEDQPAVKALILAGLEEHWGTLDLTLNPDLNDIATHYANAKVLVACESSGCIVGSGILKPHGENGEAGGTGEIVRMSVARDARRRGIGRCILDALIATARDRGYARIILETTQTWAGAIAFYRSAGFEITHYKDGDVYFVMELGDNS